MRTVYESHYLDYYDLPGPKRDASTVRIITKSLMLLSMVIMAEVNVLGDYVRVVTYVIMYLLCIDIFSTIGTLST